MTGRFARARSAAVRPGTVAAARGVHRGAPRGVVLAEVLLAAVLGAFVAGVALDALVRVMRFGQEHAARVAARAQLEQGATALTADLRPLTTAAVGDDPADLRSVADTAVELFAPMGGGVACAVGAASGVGGNTVDLAGPPDPGSARALAWWSAPPRPGDLMLVHDDAGTPTVADDRWNARAIRAVSDGTSYCRSGPFAAAVAAGSAADPPRFRVTLDAPALPGTVAAGAPVRLARRRRYSLYRAAEGWQLGVRDWDGAAWETVQPLAGPFGTPSEGGLRVQVVGAELRVLLRAPCGMRVAGRARCADSALAVVRPRGGA